jgi:hypothetical protein
MSMNGSNRGCCNRRSHAEGMFGIKKERRLARGGLRYMYMWE